MKPHRIALTHALVSSFKLHKKMQVYGERKATESELGKYHGEEYLKSLKNFQREETSDSGDESSQGCVPINADKDCPYFDSVFEFSQLYAGASIDAAKKLVNEEVDIAINWAGGLHHARKNKAFGFCYINDIVLAIMELLRYHPRVLYIDIDVHHGDGVQEAFYMTDRVMTVSFHKYKTPEFFPGTGDIDEIGKGDGKYFSLNVPLKSGITDTQYAMLFRPIVQNVIAKYRPTVIVLQCGADSLYEDLLGDFQLSLQGHAACVSYVMSFNLPLLVLGGGGYNMRNVSRCWANETSVLVNNLKIDPFEVSPYYPMDTVPTLGKIPEETAYYEFFVNAKGVDKKNRENENQTAYLNKVLEIVMEQLKIIECSPSVQLKDIPTLFEEDSEELDEDEMEDLFPQKQT
uniref:Histone deacetylase n=1 Tax=Arcella intermedia TaxID=1963864 RepID=A0A6B2L521_9EUKA